MAAAVTATVGGANPGSFRVVAIIYMPSSAYSARRWSLYMQYDCSVGAYETEPHRVGSEAYWKW